MKLPGEAEVTPAVAAQPHEPLTARSLAQLHRAGLPPSFLAERFRMEHARVAGLLGYYGLVSEARGPKRR